MIVLKTDDCAEKKGKRVFTKDMAKYFVPCNQRPVSLAPSLIASADANTPSLSVPNSTFKTTAVPIVGSEKLSPGTTPYDTPAEPNNPTVIPTALMKQFHYVFLIRHPRYSVPSFYRLSRPDLENDLVLFNPNEVRCKSTLYILKLHRRRKCTHASTKLQTTNCEDFSIT